VEGFMNKQLFFTIYESKDKYEREFISVDTSTNIPYQQWFDGGNMWGNRTIEITWEKVESFNPTKFKGINEHNWKDYI